MNSVQLVGRLTRDPQIKYSQGESHTAILRFTVAVDRKYSKQSDDNNADFIPCIAFGKTAEFVDKYFFKGSRIGLTGHIQTGSYKDKDGNTVYTTDVFAESVEFVDSKGSSNQSQDRSSDGFMAVPDGVDDDGLPFN